MKYSFFIILILVSQTGFSQNKFKWNLQVTDHLFELKSYDLDESAYKAYLKKTSWRCQVGPVENKLNLSTRELKCDYSIKKAGAVITRLTCSDNASYNDTTLTLEDQVKDLELKIMLSCKK